MEKDLKDLLLVDLCARLPYSVKILVQSWDEREMEYTNRVDTLYSVNGDNYINTTNELDKQGLYDVHKSRKHSDGTIPFGDENWFIVQAELPT